MTHLDLAQTINSLNLILDHHDSSVRLSREAELETMENSINAFHMLLKYLPEYDRNYIKDLLTPVEVTQ